MESKQHLIKLAKFEAREFASHRGITSHEGRKDGNCLMMEDIEIGINC